MRKEVWRAIAASEGQYEVSNLGNVRKHSKIVKKSTRKDGHEYVSIKWFGRWADKRVAGLVAETFVSNPRPSYFKHIFHKDGNLENNAADNLEWRSYSDFIGRQGDYAVEQYTLDGEFVREWESPAEVSCEIGLPASSIVNCCMHHSVFKQCGGFQWKYKHDDRKIERYVPQRKKIYQYTPDGKLVAVYDSIFAAARAVKRGRTGISNISRCAKGYTRMAYRHIWRFEKL